MVNTQAGLKRHRVHRRVLLALDPIHDEAVPQFVKGVSRYLAQHEKWEIYLDTSLGLRTDLAWPNGEAWDGIICGHSPARFSGYLPPLNLPMVTVDGDSTMAGIPSVAVDHGAVGRLGAEHLLDRGLLHFAFCGFSNEPKSRARCKGFLQTLQQHGRHCSLVESPAPEEQTPEWNSREIETLARWLADAPRPLGLMACDDIRGLQLIHAAEAIGLAVPEQIAVLGANNHEMRCELSRPALSSVAANEVERGYRAAEVLDRLMEGQPVEPLSLISPVGVITRASTDISAVQDKRIAAAVRFIQEHGCEPITIADVCRHAGIARTQLEEKFRAHFARSPQAEVRRVRLERIRKLLHETDLPLKTIAELTGFEHVEYLSVFFKKALGESPGRYRRRVQRVWTQGYGEIENERAITAVLPPAPVRPHPEEMERPSLSFPLQENETIFP